MMHKLWYLLFHTSKDKDLQLIYALICVEVVDPLNLCVFVAPSYDNILDFLIKVATIMHFDDHLFLPEFEPNIS